MLVIAYVTVPFNYFELLTIEVKVFFQYLYIVFMNKTHWMCCPEPEQLKKQNKKLPFFSLASSQFSEITDMISLTLQTHQVQQNKVCWSFLH